MIPGPFAERSADDADWKIQPSVSERPPTARMLVWERQRVVDSRDVNMRLPSVRSGCSRSFGPKCRHRRCGCRRDCDSTGCGVWFMYLSHLGRVQMRGIHGRAPNGSFLMVDVATFDHEVVQAAVRVQHQVVQDNESEQE